MQHRTLLTSALAVSLLAGAACNRNETKPESTEKAPATDVKVADKAKAEKDEVATSNAGKSPIWPDGYLVASEEEWIPVINTVGQKLVEARKQYAAGSSDKAANDLRAAASAMREDAKAVQGDLKSRLDQSAKDLEVTADKLAHGSVGGDALDKALVRAYRQDVPATWLYAQEETVRPFYERPSKHSAHALDLLARKDYAGAAAEIRRSTAFFRLAALSARDDDRELLQHNVDLLNKRAKQAEAGKLTPDELRQTLAQVDAAYAASYLHQAEAHYAAKDAQHATRSLREAIARMRSRLHWVGKESEAASTSVVRGIEELADKLGRGAKVAAKDVASLFKRAHNQVKTDVGS